MTQAWLIKPLAPGEWTPSPALCPPLHGAGRRGGALKKIHPSHHQPALLWDRETFQKSPRGQKDILTPLFTQETPRVLGAPGQAWEQRANTNFLR